MQIFCYHPCQKKFQGLVHWMKLLWWCPAYSSGKILIKICDLFIYAMNHIYIYYFCHFALFLHLLRINLSSKIWWCYLIFSFLFSIRAFPPKNHPQEVRIHHGYVDDDIYSRLEGVVAWVYQLLDLLVEKLSEKNDISIWNCLVNFNHMTI